MSLPKEVLKKVKMVEINTRKLVNNVFAGEYHTVFRGQGMVFKDFREYVAGDDIRSISWPLTARTGKTFVKTFEEERELTLILAVDISGSNDFGTGAYFKGEIMVHLAAVLAFSAAKNNDQVGLLLFSDQVEHFVPPKKGRGHIHRILRDLYFFKPNSPRTQIGVAGSYLQGFLKKRASVFVFSDFYDENYDQALRLLGRKHDVVACVIEDPAEHELPKMGIVEMQDPETGEILSVDTDSAAFRSDYQKSLLEKKSARDRSLVLSQVDRIDILNNEKYMDPLVAYFKKRHK